jgi:SWIM/SEC-C metal-binding protein
MSKFYYKGKIEKKPKHSSYGFSTNRETRPGTEDAPLTLIVNTDEKKAEIEETLKTHDLFAMIEVNADIQEDLSELDALISTPKTQVTEKTPGRNDPCSCGSGKKFKKCCG